MLDAIEGRNECYAQFLLLCYSIANGTGVIIWIVYQFIWFSHCGLAKFILGVTIFFVIGFYVIGLLPLCDYNRGLRKDNNIFVASLASTYITYLSWAALSSNPDEECNPFTDSAKNTIWNIIAGTIFTACTVLSIATASDDGTDNKKAVLHKHIAEDANEKEIAFHY